MNECLDSRGGFDCLSFKLDVWSFPSLYLDILISVKGCGVDPSGTRER